MVDRKGSSLAQQQELLKDSMLGLLLARMLVDSMLACMLGCMLGRR